MTSYYNEWKLKCQKKIDGENNDKVGFEKS